MLQIQSVFKLEAACEQSGNFYWCFYFVNAFIDWKSCTKLGLSTDCFCCASPFTSFLTSSYEADTTAGFDWLIDFWLVFWLIYWWQRCSHWTPSHLRVQGTCSSWKRKAEKKPHWRGVILTEQIIISINLVSIILSEGNHEHIYQNKTQSSNSELFT